MKKKQKKEFTSTANIPVYFPSARKKRWKQTWDSKSEGSTMAHYPQANLALRLVQEYKLSPELALRVVIDEKVQAAAKALAESVKDPKKKEVATKRFAEELKAVLKSTPFRMEADDKEKEKEDFPPKDKDKDEDKDPEDEDDDEKDPKAEAEGDKDPDEDDEPAEGDDKDDDEE